jgi:hypothetical protein
MNPFSRPDLEALLAPAAGPCVSIYQSTHRTPAGIEEDRLRFKNLLRAAEDRLLRDGLRGPDARGLLGPGRALLEDGLFWQRRSDGLAVFLAPGTSRHLGLPAPFQELVVVGDRFHVKPLLAVLAGDGRYYVLALSQDEVRLFAGTRYGVSEVDLEGVPASLAEALRHDDPEKQLQWHTRTQQRGGERAAMFHGHGVGTDDAKDRLLRYFRAVDSGLRDFLRDEDAPLVLAGVEYYFPIYREAGTYPHIIEEGIPGNPEKLRPEELGRRAWELVRPRFDRVREEALARCRELLGTGRASTRLEEVLPAAYHGRVDTLLFTPDIQAWGRFDPENGHVELDEAEKAGDQDLLDLAVAHALSNRGRIYPEERSRMPEGSPVAAVFRY